MESYLTQEQFDSLGDTELKSIKCYGLTALVERYQFFLGRIDAEFFWQELCDRNNVEVEFDEHVYFKTWLILFSVLPDNYLVKMDAYFKEALSADYYWQTHANAPAGQLAELFANLTPEEPCHN